MSLEKILRGLVILEVACLIALAWFSPEDPLLDAAPASISAYLSLASVVLFIVALFFLYRFHVWGRLLFTCYMVLAAPITFMVDGYSVPIGRINETLFWLGGVLDGAMLAILYLTDIKDKFQSAEKIDEGRNTND